MIFIVSFVIVPLTYQTIIVNQTFGEQNNNFSFTSNSSKSKSTLQTTVAKITLLNNTKAQHDDIPPMVNITHPAYPPTVTTGKILIQGTATDSGSGIRDVSADVHTFPFDRNLHTNLASPPIPISPNNWSQWSLPLEISKTATYDVVITVADNAGNRNYAETTINVPIPEKKNNQIQAFSKTTPHAAPKIAFVRPTFTEAAYQEHGFYDFYSKNYYQPYEKNITTDLDMLTVKIPRTISDYDTRYAYDIASLLPMITEVNDPSHSYFPNPQKFWMSFINHIQHVVPDAIVTIMRDEDVHDGHIFYEDGNNMTSAYPDNKTNSYNILILMHNEYVTQNEYDNLRQFVKNGGTIVFIDANVFNTEVRYDKDHHTITLVKGHSWELDGKAARRSVSERWYDETKHWVGGNYLISDTNDRVSFTNNPFNYFKNNTINNTHFEEQYVNNPKAKIMIDYGIKVAPDDNLEDPYFRGKKVATYSLEYGEGKVIMLGLSGRFLATNERFMWFFDNGILPRALCPEFQSCLLDNSQNDITRPLVNITHPAYPPTLTTGKILIQGTANDFDSGIRDVSAVAHTFPFDGHFRVKLASQPIPISPNNWSQWSLPLEIHKTGTYRVLIEARDNAGNPNWAETTINVPIHDDNKTDDEIKSTARKENLPKIAFVRPTFTEAAYQEHGFYRFDSKYEYIPYGKNITTDIDMLTVKTPKSVSEFRGNDIRHLTRITSLVPINGTELHNVISSNFPYKQTFWKPFIDHVKKVLPNATITVMRDEDVHDGHIFYHDNINNAYDVLLLFHSEYVTQQEYDNFKQFVKNGGTIVFIDSNVFYAEVRYDRNNHAIVLVEGHDKKFDGKAVSRSVSERWYNETKYWVGSNFLNIDINQSITFANNPFNYDHAEEQFVNNPKAKIIIDYEIKLPEEILELYSKNEKIHEQSQSDEIPIDKIKIATYSMDYGRGKVVMLGLFGQKLVKNESFLRFFDKLIAEQALSHLSTMNSNSNLIR